MSDRGQIYTLEGIFAGLIIILGIFFAIQAASTSPSAAGASNPHALQDDKAYVQDVISSMDRSTIEEAVLFWGSSGYHCTPGGYNFYTGSWVSSSSSCPTPRSSPGGGAYSTEYPPPNKFGAILEKRLGEQYGYNVRVGYHDGSGNIQYQRMVYQGEPGVGAVRGSRTVVLQNDDALIQPDGSAGDTLQTDYGDDGTFFIEPWDDDASDDLYNVVHVEVVIWRG